MSPPPKASVVPTVLAAAALAVAAAALLRSPEAGAPAGDEAPELAAAVRALTERVARLEAKPTAQTATPRTDVEQRAPAAATPPTERTAVDVGLQQQLAELTTRLHNLEQAKQREAEKKRGLAAPDSIPAALAVLLASRGVVTKVGDIEAIQENLDVLAALSADPNHSDWDRIEAYRGMLMFGYDAPEKCAAAMPGVAAILLTSQDAKARRSAAAMLGSYENPQVTNTVLSAFGRETDHEVRGQLLPYLLKLRDDPTVLQLLQQAAKNEPNAELRARIAKALK